VNSPLKDAQIVVADDQDDVARTLCRPLAAAGAHLRYVTDGKAALDQISRGDVDLVLIDMKMPPGDMGGIWLLAEMRAGGWTTPAVVLSGEGTPRLHQQGQRAGAKDWIDKNAEDDDIVHICEGVLGELLNRSLENAAHLLPTPVAWRFHRYWQRTDPEKRVLEGLHTLEAILHLAAMVGLATTPPTAQAGINAGQMHLPSMGKWRDLCRALADAPGAGAPVQRIWNALRTDEDYVNALVDSRRGIQHDNETTDIVDGARFDRLLRRTAHRMLTAWRCTIALATWSTYDGSEFDAHVLQIRGTNATAPATIRTREPLVTGELFLLSAAGEDPQPLSPWLIGAPSADPAAVRLLWVDGRDRGKLNPGTPLKYAKADGATGKPPDPGHRAGKWEAVLHWIGQAGTP
jgi:CheY-like chemotaxis protein